MIWPRVNYHKLGHWNILKRNITWLLDAKRCLCPLVPPDNGGLTIETCRGDNRTNIHFSVVLFFTYKPLRTVSPNQLQNRTLADTILNGTRTPKNQLFKFYISCTISSLYRLPQYIPSALYRSPYSWTTKTILHHSKNSCVTPNFLPTKNKSSYVCYAQLLNTVSSKDVINVTLSTELLCKRTCRDHNTGNVLHIRQRCRWRGFLFKWALCHDSSNTDGTKLNKSTFRSRESVVGILTTLWVRRPRKRDLIASESKGTVSSPKRPCHFSDSPSLLCNGYQGFFYKR